VTALVLAHAGHWLTGIAFAAPAVLTAGAGLGLAIRERRRRPRGAGAPSGADAPPAAAT
jgi:hypothetical protein